MNVIQSKTFNYLRFPLIVGVVFIHAYNTNLKNLFDGYVIDLDNEVLNMLRYFISQIISRISVPFFLFMSGFLFFYNVGKFNLNTYKVKIKSRLTTLLIPYFIWNGFVLLLLLLREYLPLPTAFIPDIGSVQNVELFDIVKSLIRKNGSIPVAYQFWFIRDLFIICLFSPLIYFIISKFKYYAIISLILVWFLGIHISHILSATTVLFFSIGAIFSILNIDLLKTFSKRYNLILFSYPVVAFCDLFTVGLPINEYIHKVGLLLGVVFIFNITSRCIAKGVIKENIYLSSASFFVFAMHEPMLTIVKTIVIKIFYPVADLSFTIIYFASSVFVIFVCLGLYRIIYHRLIIRKLLTGRYN